MKNPFSSTSVMLCNQQNNLPASDEWIYELKVDGYRMIAYIEQGNAKLVSRNGKDYSHRFACIKTALEEFFSDNAVVLDGEIVAVDENGKTDFSKLQSNSNSQVSYIIFDLLAYEGKDLREEKLVVRKQKLEHILNNSPSELIYSQHTDKLDSCNLIAVCEGEYEGIVAKKATSKYSSGRCGDWLKIKCTNRQEFVIGGYILSDKTQRIRSLLLGYYEDDELLFAGKAGNGFSQVVTDYLLKEFGKIVAKKSPFATKLKDKSVVFLKPKLLAEVTFAEFTADGKLRQAVFKGLRQDKEAKSVVLENNDGCASFKDKSTQTEKYDKNTAEFVDRISFALEKPSKSEYQNVKISSADRIVCNKPKITKGEVAQYYNEVCKKMLPYLKNRLLSLVCCPSGIGGECFFKKHLLNNASGVKSFVYVNSDGKQSEYFYIESCEGIMSLVQLNSIEFHIWGSKINNIDKPNTMVFDLDPDEGMSIEKVRQGVKDLSQVLEELNLKYYLKTSGGKGYHLVVNFTADLDYNEFSSLSKKIAEVLVCKHPERYTTNIRKSSRKGKIFIDYLRNSKGATSVCAYSLRAREGLPVSLPIAFEDLDKIRPNQVRLKN